MTSHSDRLLEIVALAVQLDNELGGGSPPLNTTKKDLAVKGVLRDMRITAINNGDYVEGQVLTHLYEYMRNKSVCDIERTVERLTGYLREIRDQISAAKVRRH